MLTVSMYNHKLSLIIITLLISSHRYYCASTSFKKRWKMETKQFVIQNFLRKKFIYIQVHYHFCACAVTEQQRKQAAILQKGNTSDPQLSKMMSVRALLSTGRMFFRTPHLVSLYSSLQNEPILVYQNFFNRSAKELSTCKQ